MTHFLKAFFITFIITLVLLFFSTKVFASDIDGFKLDEASINYKRFIGETRNPLFLHSKQKEEINVNLNTTLLNVFFFNNKIHSMTDENQYKIIGLNLFLGVRLFESLDFQVEHFSKHLLDERYAPQDFPVENSVGFVWYLHRDQGKKASMF